MDSTSSFVLRGHKRTVKHSKSTASGLRCPMWEGRDCGGPFDSPAALLKHFEREHTVFEESDDSQSAVSDVFSPIEGSQATSITSADSFEAFEEDGDDDIDRGTMRFGHSSTSKSRSSSIDGGICLVDSERCPEEPVTLTPSQATAPCQATEPPNHGSLSSHGEVKLSASQRPSPHSAKRPLLLERLKTSASQPLAPALSLMNATSSNLRHIFGNT